MRLDDKGNDGQDTASRDWCVVGGGLLGMTLGLRLAQCGHQVTILESQPHLGGLADAWEVGGLTWDRHYHVTLLSDSWLRDLLKELGLEHELRWVTTRTGFFIDRHLHSLSNSWEFLTFRPLSLVSKIRLATTILVASRIKNWRRMESYSVEEWLRRWSGNETWTKVWHPLLRAKLGSNSDRASAAFIWATISRMYAARRSGLKREMFGYLQGGYSRIVKEFQDRLAKSGVEIITGTPVRSVARTDEGIVVDYGQESRAFDSVVLTLPSALVPRVCSQLPPEEMALHSGISYQGIICASLVLKRKLSPYYVTNIADAAVPFTGIIEMTAMVDPAEFGGKHLVYLPWYVPAESDDFQLNDQEIEDRFRDGLRRIHPDLRDEEIVAFRISRVRHVMPVPAIDYSQHVPGISTSLPGLFVVNSSQIVNGTLNVNETIKLASQALPLLLGTRVFPTGSGPTKTRGSHESAVC